MKEELPDNSLKMTLVPFESMNAEFMNSELPTQESYTKNVHIAPKNGEFVNIVLIDYFI